MNAATGRLARRAGAVTAAALTTLAVSFAGAGPALGAVSAASPVVINEVYGGGGNSGATLTSDFIELHNTGPTAVDVSGWSVQHGSATGSTWAKTSLTGSIAAGGSYLVQEASGTGGTLDQPTPDATGTLAMAGAAGKVALASTQSALTCLPVACATDAAVVDLVGYGPTANSFAGPGPAPAPGNATSIGRTGFGVAATALPRNLSVGTHEVTVTYLGNATTASSSATATLRVEPRRRG